MVYKPTDLKIDVLKLSNAAVPVSDSLLDRYNVKDRETGQEITLQCNLTAGAESFALFSNYVLSDIYLSFLTDSHPGSNSIHCY